MTTFIFKIKSFYIASLIIFCKETYFENFVLKSKSHIKVLIQTKNIYTYKNS